MKEDKKPLPDGHGSEAFVFASCRFPTIREQRAEGRSWAFSPPLHPVLRQSRTCNERLAASRRGRRIYGGQLAKA